MASRSAIWAAVRPSGMVSLCCTGRAERSTASTCSSEAWAGKASSAACSGPAPLVATAATRNASGRAITPARASVAATSSSPPGGITTSFACASGPGAR